MPKQDPRKPGHATLAHALPLALAVITLALLITPLLTLASAVITDIGTFPDSVLSAPRLILLLRSLLTVCLIALLATLIAYPIARVLIARRTRRARVLSALLLCPIWLPPFMIYAAGNLLRAPDTIAGRALIDLATSSPGLRWVTIWAGYAIAVLGLALWSAPIAAVLIASGWGAKSGVYDDMIALEPIGRPRRLLFNLRLHRPILTRAFVLIAILMLGSAVPLHLAQLDTWSIVIWRQLTEHPPQQWGRIWVSALPMILIAFIGARFILTILSDRNAHEEPITVPPRASPLSTLTAVLVFALAVLIPLVAMAASLDDPRSITHFWHRNASAVTDTARTAILVAATALLIAIASAFSFSSPVRSHNRIARHALLTLCVLGLMPGVLIGAAIARTGIIGLDLPQAAPYWASLTRYAFIAAIIGALCASSESPDRRSARVQIAGPSPRAWLIATLPTFIRPLLATLPIAFLLAMFEIESAVLVTPPGIDSLPQQLLSDLHFARLEQLSAAGVNLLALGIVFSLIASLLLTRTARSRDTATEPHRPGNHI